MLGEKFVLCCGAMVLGLAANAVWAAPDAQQRMFDRLQEQERERQQQQLEEMQLPGDRPGLRLPVPDTSTPSVRCFQIDAIELKTLNDAPVPFGRWFEKPVREAEGACLDMTGIKALQAKLSNRLIDKGYVTSRVLIPEQDVSSGKLVLLVVAGQVEGFEAVGMPLRVLEWAVPAQPGDRVNLERSLAANGRLGGHFVTGHIDGLGRIEIFEERGKNL
ncbi:MAG: POTRA domain-containing protein, partial [Alcanivorax sp.]